MTRSRPRERRTPPPHRAALTLLGAMLCVASSGCDEASNAGVTSQPVEDTARPADLPDVPALRWDAATTSPDIATHNLRGSVDAAELRYERLGDVSSARRLIALLDLRVQFLGEVDELGRSLEVARSLAERRPEDPAAARLLASASMATHRFDEARDALDHAEALGADVRTDREALAVATGVGVDDALASREARAAAAPSFETWSAVASAAAAAGAYDRADEAFRQALANYRDVSPFAVAWVQFQRGVLWGEAVGRSDVAEALYRDAVRTLPSFVVANVHLAELEAESDAAAAIDRLRGVDEAADPEPWSRLAEYLRPAFPAAAEEARDEAARRYGQLLADEELAFADHAAEFYLGAGADPERAWTLASTNLANRKNDRSYELAVTAALASGRNDTACVLLAEAGDDRQRVGLVELRETTPCGD